MSEPEHPNLRDLLEQAERERDYARSLLGALLSMPNMDRTVTEYQRVALGWVAEVKEARAANVVRRAQEAMAKTEPKPSALLSPPPT